MGNNSGIEEGNNLAASDLRKCQQAILKLVIKVVGKTVSVIHSMIHVFRYRDV